MAACVTDFLHRSRLNYRMTLQIHDIKGIGSTTDAPTEYMKNKQFVTDFYCDDQY